MPPRGWLGASSARFRLPASERVDWPYNNLFKHPAR